MLKKIVRKIKAESKEALRKRKNRTSRKIFGIGFNKTGTSSLGQFLSDLGIPVLPQLPAEELLEDWHQRKFDRLISLVRDEAIAFQDVPFSMQDTYKALDKAFPGSKFILTVRDNPDQWYNSVVSYHARQFSKGKIATVDELKAAEYVYKGWVYDSIKYTYNTPDEDLYNKERLICCYNNHNHDVMEYFKTRPEQLLVVNFTEPDVAKRICAFLDIPYVGQEVRWMNKT